MTNDLPDQLNSFDAATRKQALAALQAAHAPVPIKEPLHVNMHCHTFFSYNGYGASPSRVAWEARQNGWYAAGICDFDVLDGMDEFLQAADQLGLRGTANVETRVFFREYADKEINSPGEPGVYYFMGAGFVKPPPAGTPAADQLAGMRHGVEHRNRGLLERVNAYLETVTLDYDKEVLPLTPNGNATERHICAAFYAKGKEVLGSDELTAYWAAKLDTPAATMADVLQDPMAFSDLLRAKLMKRGGPGYVQPNAETFPALDDVIAMVLAAEAIPMATWLDGMSDGEADINAILECQIAKGVAALNIIPDRNWNLSDPDKAKVKVARLHECVAAADRLGLPLNVGTELNKYGQKWVDDFTAGAMAPVTDSFIRGANIMVGHTRLLRFAGFSYISEKARREFPDVADRNAFFAAVGALPDPAPADLAKLTAQSADANFAALADAARRGAW